jgi:hypothetical protein
MKQVHLLFISGLILATVCGCESSKRISVTGATIEYKGALRHIAMIQAPWMKTPIQLRFPETIQTDTMDFIDTRREGMQPRVPSEPYAKIWSGGKNGLLEFVWEYDNQTAGGMLAPQKEEVRLEVWLENRRAVDVPVMLQFCPVLKDTVFEDRALTRTWLHTAEGWKRMADTDRGAGKFSLCHYSIEGEPKVLPPLPWGAGKEISDNGLAAVVSEDGKYVFAMTWGTPRSILSNADIPCIHADPKVKFAKAGQKAVYKGKVYLIKGSLEDLLKRVQEAN